MSGPMSGSMSSSMSGSISGSRKVQNRGLCWCACVSRRAGVHHRHFADGGGVPARVAELSLCCQVEHAPAGEPIPSVPNLTLCSPPLHPPTPLAKGPVVLR